MAQSLTLCFLIAASLQSQSIRLDYDPSVDTSLLPYSVIIKDAATSPCDRPPVRHSLRAVSVANRPEEIPTYVSAINPYPGDAPEAHLNWNPLGNRTAFDESPLLGAKIEDIAVVPRGDSVWIFGNALRRDSLHLFKSVLPSGKEEWLTIAPVVDRDGDGKWSGNSVHLLTSDYDFDGQTELFFYFNAVRDIQPRELICIEADSFHLEWRLKVASPVHVAFPCGDSTDPGIIFATEAPGQNVSDSVFNDSYGYLARVDRTGRVVFAHRKSTFPNYLHMDVATAQLEFYVLGISLADTIEDTRLSHGILEKVTATGEVIAQVADSEFSTTVWTMDLDNDGTKEVVVFNKDRSIQVFSANLEKLFHSKPGFPISDAFSIQKFDGKHDARMITLDGGESGIFDAHFNLLALLPATSQCEVLARDTTGQVTVLILNNYAGHHYFATLSKRSTRELAVIFYRKNHVYFLSGSFALLAALFVTAVYQRKTKSNLRTIDSQRKELADAHQQLKDAQPAVIAREKYLQAKDIAGGFAHEIRNALFPADTALMKLNEQMQKGDLSNERREKLIAAIGGSIGRAVDITRLISDYTKLDSQQMAEPVNLAQVVRDTLKANSPLIETQSVRVTVDGDESVKVQANHAQMKSVLTNLLLNSLYALRDRPEPTIQIAWRQESAWCELTFADNGTGISAEDLPRVFDAFFSTKPNQGTGLGLATVKKIVEMYGGTIAVSSVNGSSTEFRLRMVTAGAGQ